ncbi:monovalent cation/H+ antiporter complex subunit F [Parvularcula marina]|uniref:pH regulation protein F n=1 Tax=Parvularcula marina TaxID=2292771 RepID=A0A371RKD3_9PROT|nr:monovalent cation/H+ antiporter complex subunit F [Parvularcula marina]RFB05901.1 pH regulation protein F [Parvularcula marina]
MFVAAAAAIVVGMVIVLARAIAGPTLYDRVLAVNSFGTKTVLLLAVVFFMAGRPEFLDVALLYALLNFVATIAILKFFRYEALSPVMEGGALAENPGTDMGGPTES